MTNLIRPASSPSLGSESTPGTPPPPSSSSSPYSTTANILASARYRIRGPSPLGLSQTGYDDLEGYGTEQGYSASEQVAEETLTWWQEVRFGLSDLRTKIYLILVGYSLFFIVYGMLVPVFWPIQKEIEEELGGFWVGTWRIITDQSTLITDAVFLGGPRVALVNAGVAGLLLSTVAFSTRSVKYGYYFATGWFVLGWSLAGKNLYNVWPNLIGVTIYSRVKEKPLGDLIGPLIFGTSMAPVVSVLSFHTKFHPAISIILGIAMGIFLGFCLASVMEHMLALHRGFTLYNIGTAAGFLGLVFYMIIEGFEFILEPRYQWCETANVPMMTLLFILSASLIILGFLLGGSFQDEAAILRTTGKLPCDFVEIASLGGALINMGLMCFLGTVYTGLVRADFSGPVVCGICGMAGFGAMGKHPKNCIPIMAGVCGMGLLGDLGVFYWHVSSPSAMMAATFCTSLAPVSGVFGPFAGVLVGMLHLAMASHIAAVHGWMVLYNNGFAGGLVMTFVVAIINGLKPEMLEQVAPVAQVAPNWTKNVADAYQSFQVESLRLETMRGGGLGANASVMMGDHVSDDDTISHRERFPSHYTQYGSTSQLPPFAARTHLATASVRGH